MLEGDDRVERVRKLADGFPMKMTIDGDGPGGTTMATDNLKREIPKCLTSPCFLHARGLWLPTGTTMRCYSVCPCVADPFF